MVSLLTVLGFPALSLFVGCEENIPFVDDQEAQLVKLYDLPGELGETSGLLFWDALLWSLNDGGNLPVIYGIDPADGTIVREVTISNADNNDWESIAQDRDNLYIGDFGNNSGVREDLQILVVSKSSISTASEQEVEATGIFFSYADQTDFEPARYANSFDCEAMVAYGGNLLIFTKDWVNETSTMYTLPAVPGEYVAKEGTVIETEGLVTGAEVDTVKHQLLLCGYDQYVPFLLRIPIISGAFDFGSATRYELTDFIGYQIEAIALWNGRILLTNENSAAVQAVWEFTTSP